MKLESSVMESVQNFTCSVFLKVELILLLSA